MYIGKLRAFGLAVLFSLVASLSAATPFTGFYTGTMHLTISGNVSMPERAIGPVGFNINEDGSVTSSGDLTGTVDSNGNITWVQPNAGNFQTGKVEAGVITSTGSVNNDGTISTFRVRASNTAPGFSGTSPLAGRIEQVNPKQTLNSFSRVRYVNGRFMGVGARGSIGFSEDGLNWSRFGVGTTLPLYDIAYGNGMYVVVGDAGAVFTSPDGVMWTARSTGTAAFNSVAFGNGKFMRSTFTGATQTSTDGITWQSTPVFVSGGFSAYGGLDFVNNLFVIYAGAHVVTSADGVTTNSVGSAPSGSTISIASAGRVVYGNGVWVTAGMGGCPIRRTS
jgi:hypothetical protein